jgi:16S rRNA (cytidine1402-2'-O)-methyltransferase
MPTLYLIPTPLGDAAAHFFDTETLARLKPLRHFVVEAEKTARKHLKGLGLDTPIQALQLKLLNEHTPASAIVELLAPLKAGEDMGLLSEAGCPAVADPGAALVALAHQQGYTVAPLIGPSSLLLALMSSGACGQRFRFHGYLPIEETERVKTIKQLESDAYKLDETQIFIETPYRNNAMLAQLLSTLRPTSRLAIACDLTLATQTIVSFTVNHWPKTLPNLHKRPCVFIVYAK